MFADSSFYPLTLAAVALWGAKMSITNESSVQQTHNLNKSSIDTFRESD